MSAVAVLGLGAMGSALAGALVARGHEVVGWNRTAGRGSELAARRAATAAEAVREAGVVVVCLLDADAVDTTLDPLDLAGKEVVNLTSSTPERARRTARLASARGATYLDGGIMAVPRMIGRREALVLYAGDEAAFDRHRSLLDAFGSARFVGTDAGRAAVVDLSLLGAMYGLLGGFLSAAVVARSEGTSATELAAYAVPFLGAMTQSLAETAARIDARRFGDDVGSSLAMQAHAFELLVEASRRAGADPAILVAVRRWIDDAVARGHGDDDLARLVDFARIGPG